MITADQLLAHAIGDYVLQSDWMASKKRTEHLAAAVHALTYTLPFAALPWVAEPVFYWYGTSGVVVTPEFSWLALAVILVTHFLIDRYGLARYVVWAKNFLAPRWLPYECGCEPPCPQPYVKQSRIRNPPWSKCSATGYPPDRPPFLAVWLLIIADNILHVVINGLALRFL